MSSPTHYLDVCITVRSCRKAPVRTLENYDNGPYPLFLVSDPDTYEANRAYYAARKNTTVVLGVKGSTQQLAHCYKVAADAGFPYFFHMDDDLWPKTFVHMEKGVFPTLPEVVAVAMECIFDTNTTLAGFTNSSVRNWMKPGFSRTHAMIHGCANIGRSDYEPWKNIFQFPEDTFCRYDDLYRTCRHREISGGNGRVNFIGLDTRRSAMTSPETTMPDIVHQPSIDLITSRFPNMLRCDSVKHINQGQHLIPNWKWLK